MGRKSANHGASEKRGLGGRGACSIKVCFLLLLLQACSTHAPDDAPASPAADTVIDRTGKLVPRAACNDTCASAGFACGELCGSSCGTCSAAESCIDGWCKRDAGTAADGDDARELSSACGLRLRLLGRSGASVQLGIELAELSPELTPRLIDVEVRANRLLDLTRLDPGAALANTHVTLTRVGRERERADSFRLLLSDPEHSRPLAAGELARLTFDDDDGAPISFWLARREQTFAPFAADVALRACSFEQTLQVLP